MDKLIVIGGGPAGLAAAASAVDAGISRKTFCCSSGTTRSAAY